MSEARIADLDAEKAVLGAVLVDRRCLPEVAAEMVPEDLYDPRNRAIYESMLELDANQAPIDSVSLVESMRSRDTVDKLNSVGGVKYLDDLVLGVVTTSNIGFHARAIATKAERRRWVEAATELRSIGKSGDMTDVEYLAKAEAATFALTSRKRSGGPVGVKPIMHAVANTLAQRFENRAKGGITGVPCGLESVDLYTSGWQPADLIVVAARPSMGKTAFAMTAAISAAVSGCGVLFFNLEMRKESLVERMVSMDGGIDSGQLRTGFIETPTWVRLHKTFGRIAGLPIWIDDESALKISEIRSRARRWRMNEGAKFSKVLVIVDYIGLARSDTPFQQRHREVAQISNGLKAMAKDIASPVMALSQLNRDCEKRDNKRPMLSDIKESGDIEQDADVIAFLYRDDYYNKESNSSQCDKCEKGVAEVIVAKQRNGTTGSAHVGWKPEFTKFVNLSNRE